MGQRTYVWNLPVSPNYDGFLRDIRRRVATRVASRTLGPNGQPVRREIGLTENNQSLRNTYSGVLARGMERADIRAVFHTSSGGRVESITFSPPRVIPLEPTTITARPPSPRPVRPPTPPTPPGPPPRPRRSRGQEDEGQVGGVRGPLSDRYFYGIHTTQHNTMCYGRYDYVEDYCDGPESTNTMANRLHFDQGERDLMYLMRNAGTDVVRTDAYQARLRTFERRMNSGRRASGPLADQIYRQGGLHGYRRARMSNPSLPKRF